MESRQKRPEKSEKGGMKKSLTLAPNRPVLPPSELKRGKGIETKVKKKRLPYKGPSANALTPATHVLPYVPGRRPCLENGGRKKERKISGGNVPSMSGGGVGRVA